MNFDVTMALLGLFSWLVLFLVWMNVSTQELKNFGKGLRVALILLCFMVLAALKSMWKFILLWWVLK